MNKKRKLLTALALAAFGAIIFFHYCDPWFHQGQLEFGTGGAWHGGRYQAGSIEPLITDVRMPLFALAVVYAGLFFLLGGKDAEPVPRRPGNWRRIIGIILAGLVIADLITAIIYSHEEEKRKQATRQADIEYEASKHRITESEIDLTDLRLGRLAYGTGYVLNGRIRNRAAHSRTLDSIKLTVWLREKADSDIVGEQTVEIRVEVPPHQTRAIGQIIHFANSPQLTQFAWGYYISEIRGSKGYAWQDAPIVKDFDPDKYLGLTPTPSPKRAHVSPTP